MPIKIIVCPKCKTTVGLTSTQICPSCKESLIETAENTTKSGSTITKPTIPVSTSADESDRERKSSDYDDANVVLESQFAYLPAQRPGIGRTVRLVGISIAMTGLVLLFTPQFYLSAIATKFDKLGIVLLLLSGIMGFSLLFAGSYLALWGKKHSTKTGYNNKGKMPILFLRPFSEDGKIGWFSLRRVFRFPIDPVSYRILRLVMRGALTYEAVIEYAFRKVGHFIAIGKPGEKLPEIGATRSYLPESNWRPTVRNLIKNSQLVLLCIGESQGLLWEIRECLRSLKPEQFVLCLPYPDRKSHRTLKTAEMRRQEVYRKFRENTLALFSSPLPENIKSNQFIYFDNEWNPQKINHSFLGFISSRALRSKGKAVQNDYLKTLRWLSSVLVVPVWWRLTLVFWLQWFLLVFLPLQLLLILLTEASALAPFIYTVF